MTNLIDITKISDSALDTLLKIAAGEDTDITPENYCDMQAIIDTLIAKGIKYSQCFFDQILECAGGGQCPETDSNDYEGAILDRQDRDSNWY